MIVGADELAGGGAPGAPFSFFSTASRCPWTCLSPGARASVVLYCRAAAARSPRPSRHSASSRLARMLSGAPFKTVSNSARAAARSPVSKSARPSVIRADG